MVGEFVFHFLLILRINVSSFIDLKNQILAQSGLTVMRMKTCVCFQAYATVVSAAEGNNPDSDHFGKVEEVKQYPYQHVFSSY